MLHKDLNLDIDLDTTYWVDFLMDLVDASGFRATQSGGRGERHGGD